MLKTLFALAFLVYNLLSQETVELKENMDFSLAPPVSLSGIIKRRKKIMDDVWACNDERKFYVIS